MNPADDREPTARFTVINTLRTVFTGLACFLTFQAGQVAPGWILAILLLFAVLWLLITLLWISAELQSGYLSLLPTFFDITLLTVYIYFTGGTLSTALLIYVYVVAVSSMNSRAPQGLFAAAYIVILYSGLTVAMAMDWLEPRNIVGPIRRPDPLEMAQSLTLVTVICFGVYFMIRGLVRSLESKNETLIKQAEDFQEVNRDLAAKNRMIKDELVVARKIQETLIPSKTVEGKGFKLESRYIALHEVGGDYLDFFMKREGHHGILVADAAGHGVPAALVASMTKMAAEQHKDKIHHPRHFLSSLNRAILDRTNLHFVAAIYALYHARRRKLEYCVAGNPPPYLVRPGEPARLLEGQGSVLGVIEEPRLNQYQVRLEPGDRIVFFTDGIDECRNARGEQLSQGQLEALLTGISSLEASENVADRIVSELENFTSGRGFEDDVTLVVLTVEPYK